MRLLLIVLISIPCIAIAQVTNNKFVGAKSAEGYLTFYNGDPRNGELLSYIDKSYLTVQVDGRFYSNNPMGGKLGPSGANQPIDVSLTNGSSFKVRDTLRTIWKESGFDIIQDAYPVAFTNSGVIVLSIKIVNHTALSMNAQAQFLLDNMNSNMKPGGGSDSANDNPYLIHRYGYIRNWQDCPPNPLPSFYLAFEFPPTEFKLGTVGIGYANDSFPPRPLGLKPLSLIEFGNWPAQINYTWGVPNPGDRYEFTDEAALLMGQPAGATPFVAGVTDSVTEIMRTAYGTPEWCYDHGKIVGFALYPHHLYWDPRSQTYTPNPFPVETFLFNVEDGALGNTTIRQTVGDPIRITSPKPSGLSKDTTQVQSAGSIQGGGFSDLRWVDSAVVLPTGCAASFPVDIRFDVKIGGDTSQVFTTPWDCSITVDCANPDTLPPAYANSIRGCDSTFRNTITVADNRQFDLGLDTITYSSPDLKASQYSVTFNPPPPYSCARSAVQVTVQQLDTLHSGHVILALTDCANNISRDTLCFTAHPPLPDKTAPVFYLDSAVRNCHAQCTEWTVADTTKSTTSIDRGVDSIVVVSSTNMALNDVPTGGKYPANTPLATLHVCVVDSMRDGKIVLRSSDTAHNFRLDTITYCTTNDTIPPIAIKRSFDQATATWQIHVTDTQAWDRGIDSVWMEQYGNTVTVPTPLPNPVGCKHTFDFSVRVVDTTKCAHATIRAKDCAGNISAPLLLTFTKGAKPVITASKTLLCTATDSIVLDAGGPFANYLWSSGETTRQIIVRKAGTYTVTVDDGEGCGAASDPVTISFSPVTVEIAPPGPLKRCQPDSAQLDAGPGFASYQWLKDGNPVSGATSQKLWVSTTGAYTVQATNAAGCMGISAPVNVTIYPTPPKPVITLSNSVLSSTVASSYQWSVDGNPITGATQQTYTPSSGGNYTVTITDVNGCSNTSDPFSNVGSVVVSVPSIIFARESDHVTIPLNLENPQSVPQASRTYTVRLRFNKTLLVPDGGASSAVVQGSDLVVQYSGQTNISQGVIQNIPFIAALGDDSCTTITIDTFYWSTPNISVTRRNGNFCLSDLCKQGGTRLIDPEGKVTLSAKPNPVQNNIEVNYELIEQGQTTLIIYDMLGHEALRVVDGEQTRGTYAVSADVSTLPPGVYICTLHTPTIVKSQRLQIVR